jgi:uncharacterized protein (DUF1330 family)
VSAYFLVELDTHNQAGMESYRAAVPGTIEQHGGRYLPAAAQPN